MPHIKMSILVENVLKSLKVSISAMYLEHLKGLTL